MNTRAIGIAALGELLLLALLAGSTLLKIDSSIHIPSVQIVSISRPGTELTSPPPQKSTAPAKSTTAVKPSEKASSTPVQPKTGPSGSDNGIAPKSYPGDRDAPSPYTALAVTYPKEAQNEEWEGEVVVKVSVDQRGRATDTQVIQSSGHLVLDRAFEQAIMKMAFKPRRQQGQDVSGTIELRHRFKL